MFDSSCGTRWNRETAMACRLLKSLEDGRMPDDGGPMSVDGVVYLSATGKRRVNVPNMYADLSKLLPEEFFKQNISRLR